MSFENLLQRLQALDAVLSSEGTAKRISAAGAFAAIGEYKNRIFVDGLATDGSAIGQYSTRPYYQNPNALIGVPTGGVSPQGRNGSATFKNGKPKKTRYLPGGYAELRELTGRQSNTVDLNFSGSLERSVMVTQTDSVASITYTNEFEAEKMEGNEIRFGKTISEPSEEERQIGINAAAEELRTILNEID